MFSKGIALFLASELFFSAIGMYLPAQAAVLPLPGTLVFATPAFKPLSLNGLIIDPSDPLRFNFIINEGDTGFSEQEIKKQSQIMLNYFLAALAMPEKDIWVNLSPNEANRIIPDKLAMTDMGRDLLAQDYILKQLAASLTHPDTQAGKKYWQDAGTAGARAFKRIWIMPDHATVYQDKGRVYIGEAHLKVTTEEGPSFKANILPLIEKEVNEGKNFAPLRQIYHAIILSIWFKKALKQSMLYRGYANKKNTEGIADISLSEKKQIYERYLESLQRGAYSVVRRDRTAMGFSSVRVTDRTYFCGGVAVPQEFVDNGVSVEQVDSIPAGGSARVVTAQVEDLPASTADEPQTVSRKKKWIIWPAMNVVRGTKKLVTTYWRHYTTGSTMERCVAVTDLLRDSGMSILSTPTEVFVRIAKDSDIFEYLLFLAKYGQLDRASLTDAIALFDRYESEYKHRSVPTALVTGGVSAVVLELVHRYGLVLDKPQTLEQFMVIAAFGSLAGYFGVKSLWHLAYRGDEHRDAQTVMTLIEQGAMHPLVLNPALLNKLPPFKINKYFVWAANNLRGVLVPQDVYHALSREWGFSDQQLVNWDIRFLETINTPIPDNAVPSVGVTAAPAMGKVLVKEAVAVDGVNLRGRLTRLEDGAEVDLSSAKIASASERADFMHSLNVFIDRLEADSGARTFAYMVADHAHTVNDLFLTDLSAQKFWGMPGKGFIVIDKNRLKDTVACFHEALEHYGLSYGTKSTIGLLDSLLDDKAKSNIEKWRRKYQAQGQGQYFQDNILHFYARAFTRQYAPQDDRATTAANKGVGGVTMEHALDSLQFKGQEFDFNASNTTANIISFDRLTMNIVAVGSRRDVRTLMQTSFR